MEWIREKRTEMLTVVMDGNSIDIRDQKPLYAGKTHFEAGWTFGDLIQHLNERVFFWPGWMGKPICYGMRHFDTYVNAGEKPAILRVKTQDILEANQKSTPTFCKYNSGSPRTRAVNGKGMGSPRGPDTFVECHHAPYSACNVVEVTFVDSVNLPSTVEYGEHPGGPWSNGRTKRAPIMADGD